MPSHAANMGMLEPRHLDSYKLNDPGGVGVLKPRVDGDKYTRPNRVPTGSQQGGRCPGLHMFGRKIRHNGNTSARGCLFVGADVRKLNFKKDDLSRSSLQQ